ncbi:hypothetical protein ACIF8T_34180 [Streptomyces sp. NPDC085946]|uniref:hypothetical protein n=1 Tax=Streptomyces sp. NPDC085946 TaxID=3365744 RepID=UPI0037D459C8
MKRMLWGLPVLAAGIAVARKARPAGRATHPADDRWLTVTVNLPPKEVRPDGALPEPLDRYADRIDVEVRPAPGERGTELAVRLKEPPSAAEASLPGRLAGQDPRQEIRRALRDAKAILEAGEVLHPDTPATTRPTPGGKVIGLLGRRSGGEGVL